MSYLSRMGILGRLAIESSRPVPPPPRPQAKPRPVAKAIATLADGTTIQDILRGQGIHGRGTPQQIAAATDIFSRLKEIER